MRSRLLILALLLGTFAQPAIAEDVVITRSGLSLERAVAQGVAQSHGVAIAQTQLNAATGRLNEAIAAALPQVALTSSFRRTDPINPAGGGGAFASNPQFASLLGTSSSNAFSTQLSATQVIFAGGRVLGALRVSELNVKLAEEALRQARQEAATNVTAAYFNALRATQVVKSSRESVEMAQAQVDLAQKQEKAGVGIKFDVIRAKTQLINAQQLLSQAVNSERKSLQSLNLALGQQIESPLDLTGKHNLPEKLPLPEDALKIALDSRSEVKQLNIRKAIGETTVEVQSRSNWPTLSANASYSFQDNQIINGNANNTQNLAYGVNLNWPVFDGFATAAKTEQAKSQLDQDRFSLDRLNQSIANEIRGTWLDMQEAGERLLLADEGVIQAKEALRLAQLRYQAGVGISLDVLDAQTRLTQANVNRINALFDLSLNKARYIRAMGNTS